ncbi:MAG: glycosyltransferase family 4 protein [Gammaproteobacteria bacterium]|nr:glycosyltransferase family 4 protein [Gammaproteobacteria bacterium]
MKILHIEAGRHLYGGALQVAYLIEGLERRGIECVLVCCAGSAIAQSYRKRLASLYEMAMGGDLDLAMIWRIGRIIKRERPDLVHLHSRRGAEILGGLAARQAGVPVVLSRRVDNPEHSLVVRWKYRLYDKVITISEGIYRVLLEEGVAADKLVCVRSAVSPDAYQQACDHSWFRDTLGLEARAKVLGVIAQLIPRKGHRFLLEALPGLLESFPTLKVVFFGQGAEEARLRQQVDALNLQDKVIFAGFRTDLPKILPCLDLVVHPALMEGLGISLLQAAGAGVPIVAVDSGGMPEVVRDGHNGLLVPPGDSAALRRAIHGLLSDRSMMTRMGQAGAALVAREFSIDRMVEGNLQVYRELCGNHD